jgi:hypothetical protein
MKQETIILLHSKTVVHASSQSVKRLFWGMFLKSNWRYARLQNKLTETCVFEKKLAYIVL